MQPALPSPLDIEALRKRRHGMRFGQRIEYFPEIDSTSSHAEMLARAGADEGTVVIAEAQTRGRGRMGRGWSSPAHRNLYLSMVLRPTLAPEEAPKLALVAGLAATEAIGEWCERARVKWPNDVLIDGRKVAGILCEMGMDGERLGHVVLGIGVNLNIAVEDFPDDLRDKAGSLMAAIDSPVDRVVFADRLLTRLQTRYDEMLRDGFGAIRPHWESLSCLTGARVCIDEPQRRYEGTVLGLADDGSLRLREDDGKEAHVIAADVTIVGGYARPGGPSHR